MSSFNSITFPPDMLDDPIMAGKFADMLIGSEVSTQDRMWGDANNRADASKGQLLGAACAQSMAVHLFNAYRLYGKEFPSDREVAFNIAKGQFYPEDWSGFRDYGSDIANLAVAAAYIRNEIKRRLMKGEPHYRAPRTTPYKGAQPNEPA